MTERLILLGTEKEKDKERRLKKCIGTFHVMYFYSFMAWSYTPMLAFQQRVGDRLLKLNISFYLL